MPDTKATGKDYKIRAAPSDGRAYNYLYRIDTKFVLLTGLLSGLQRCAQAASKPRFFVRPRPYSSFSRHKTCITASVFSLLLCFLVAPATFGQVGGRLGQQSSAGGVAPGGITIRVQLPDKTPYDNAVITLRTFSGAPLGTQTTVGQGQASFQDLPKATFNIEVMAPGFETVTQEVEIITNGDQQYVTVVLKPLPGTDLSLARSGPPILAPGAQKDLNKAIEALRAEKPDEAKKHLDKAVHSAPSNPDVNYILGMYYVQQKDYAHAEEYWKKAIQIYPLHTNSLSALGSLDTNNGKIEEAIGYF